MATPDTPILTLSMILTIIQARMASSRLPGKVLLDIAGKPMLRWVVERARLAETVDQVVVATTTDPSDDPVADFCEAQAYRYFRGSLHDVLDRYVQAARPFEADLVVRVTADCPLVDPGLIDETANLVRRAACDVRDETAASDFAGWDSPQSARRPSHALDFAANRLPPPWGRTYPIGLDVEVAAMEALERAWAETTEKHHREHVMPYFYDDLPPAPLAAGRVYETPRGFRIAQLHHETDYGGVRWTVDTPEDLEAVRALAALLPAGFTWLDALAIWQAHPEIAAMNAGVRHKTARDIDTRA